VDVLLTVVGQRLSFSWGPRGTDGFLSLPTGRCVSVTARPVGGDGSLSLEFGFLPTRPNGGSGLVAVRMTVAVDRAEAARRFVAELAREHCIANVSWPPPPGRVPRDHPDWLNAPASPATEALLASVLERLAGAES
jgi:hypothetical protein